MPTVYPGALDSFVNPSDTDTLDSPPHDEQHADVNDAMEAVQAELGLNPRGAFATVRARLDVIGAPGVFDWVPTHTGLTIGNGTVVARYQQVGGVAWFYWSLDCGTTTVMGTSPGISLPVTASHPANDFVEDQNVVGQCIMRQSGARTVLGVVALRSNTVMVPRALTIVSNLVEEINIAGDVPWAWGPDDRLVVIGDFEAA